MERIEARPSVLLGLLDKICEDLGGTIIDVSLSKKKRLYVTVWSRRRKPAVETVFGKAEFRKEDAERNYQHYGYPWGFVLVYLGRRKKS